MKQSLFDQKIDEKETFELKKTKDRYLNKTKDIMKNTKFSVENVFGDLLGKQSNSTEQITKLIIFFSQNDMNVTFEKYK